MGNTYNSRGLGRTLAAGGLVLGALCWLASTAISPAWADDTAAYLGEVASSPGRHVASGLLFLLGSVLMLPGLLAVVRLLRGRRGLVGQAGASMIAVAALIAGGLALAVNVFEVALAESTNRAEAVAISERSEESTAAMVAFFTVFLGGFVLGLVLLAVGLVVRRAVPAWVGVLVAAPVVLLFVADDSALVSTAGMAVLVAAFAAIAWRLLSIPEEQWRQPQPLPEAPNAGGAAPRPVSPAQ